MHFSRLILPILIILLAFSACSVPPEEEEFSVEVSALGLYPASNGHYAILALKTTRDNASWTYFDSLMFISVDTSENDPIMLGIPFQTRPYVRNQWLLDDGNIMLFGNLNSEDYSWYYSTAVYTPAGTLVWDLAMADRTNGVAPSSSGDLYVFGWGESDDYYDIITYAMTDTDGDTLWSRSIKTSSYNTSLESGTPTSDGGCVAVGEVYIDERSLDILVAKINSTGDTLWTHSFGGNNYDNVNFVKELNDGSILVIGELNLYDSTNANWGLNSGEQIYLIKLSSNGDKLWTKAVGNTLRESANALIETADGSLILCGTRSQSYVYLFDTTQGWVSKLTSEGDEVWIREFDRKIPTGVRELPNGELLVVTNNLDPEYEWRNAADLDLMKITSSGTLLWDRVLTP